MDDDMVALTDAMVPLDMKDVKGAADANHLPDMTAWAGVTVLAYVAVAASADAFHEEYGLYPRGRSGSDL